MIIDLESWEIGYADGQLGRPSECPGDCDQLSYSSGYREGRAARAGNARQARLRQGPRRLRALR
jgi:hypothetical protein